MMKFLDDVELRPGGHSANSGEMCAMEAVAWLAGLAHTDRPQCTSPVIATAMRKCNDWLSDDKRNELLKPLLLEVIGTNTGIEDDSERAQIAADYAQQFAALAPQSKGAASYAKWATRVVALDVAKELAAKDAVDAAVDAARCSTNTVKDEVYALIPQMILDMCKVGK